MKKELTIKESQEIALEILNIVVNICEKEGFRYSLAYGTLLGAVRHQGFIPWDDDVDIIMPRNDYNKLLLWLKNNISQYPYLKVFNREECAEYPYMITRISDDRYVIDMENEKPYGMGIFIDIYPYDGLGQTEKEAVKYGLKCDHLSSLCYQATRKHFDKEMTKPFSKVILKFFVFIFAKICGKDLFQNKLNDLSKEKDYETNNYVGCVVWLSGGVSDIFLKEWFDEMIKLKFEQYEFLVPKEYDKILKHIYGEYMKFPPMEEQIGHHFYKIYKKQ